MLWLVAAREGLDDDHAPAAARAWLCQRGWLIGLGRCVGLGRHGWRYGEQRAGARDICDATAIGEQPVMPDAMQALGQHVHQEAADKLVCRQRHGLVATGSLDPVILPFEG